VATRAERLWQRGVDWWLGRWGAPPLVDTTRAEVRECVGQLLGGGGSPVRWGNGEAAWSSGSAMFCDVGGLRWPSSLAVSSCSSQRWRKVRRGRRGRTKMVRARSSPWEWTATASTLTSAWGTAVQRPARTGGHRRGKREGWCALDWSGGSAEGEKGGDDGTRSLLKRCSRGAE
jgi:hypothetical protein